MTRTLLSIVRFVIAWLIFATTAYLWQKAVTAMAIWWVMHHPPAVPPEVDTYFMKRVWIAWLVVILPLFPFAIWIWQLPASRRSDKGFTTTESIP